MPTQTFKNLDQEKKDRIFQAGLLEFTYHEKETASVNNIVKIANISKGSFYQYFHDKDDFYWFIVMQVFFDYFTAYDQLMKKHEGDIFSVEEEIFLKFLSVLDHKYERNLIKNVLQNNYLRLQHRLLEKGTTIYIDNYDLLIKFGFKGYIIKTKEEFLLLYEFLRSIQTSCISKYLIEEYSKQQTIEYYYAQIEMLKKGILKRGIFN